MRPAPGRTPPSTPSLPATPHTPNVRTVLVVTASLVLFSACGSDGGGGDTSPQSVTVPSEYPQLTAGEGLKIAASLDGASFELVTEEALHRGYLPTYGLIAEEAGGPRDLTVFGLWSLGVGTYSYPGLDVGLDDGDVLLLSSSCEDSQATDASEGRRALWSTPTRCLWRWSSASEHLHARPPEVVESFGPPRHDASGGGRALWSTSTRCLWR